MLNVGTICDLSFSRHPQFKSYFYALEKMFGSVKLVNGKSDLLGIDILVVGDDHYEPHRNILQSTGFIECCNTLGIKVVVLTTEATLNSRFPWDIKTLDYLSQINMLYHFTADVDDCIALGIKVHRISISCNYENIYSYSDKKNKAVFIGSMGTHYEERKATLEFLNKAINIDIIRAGVPTWMDYMKILSQYRFVLSPIGCGNFLPTRFYEALAVGSIPIQQVRNNTLDYYDIEKGFDDCIFFENPSEVQQKIKECSLPVSHNRLWTEDNLKIIFEDVQI